MWLNESLGGRRLEGELEFYHLPTSALDFCQTSDRYFDLKFKILFGFISMFTATRISQKNSQDPLGRSRAEIYLEVTFAILICLYVVNWYFEMQTVSNISI